MSSSVQSASPSLVQYSVDWNNVALQAITAGLDCVPVVGDFLSHLVAAFWPPSGEDVWAEIKQQVENLINQSISADDYDRVQAQLGSAAEQSGLIGVLNNYLGSIATPSNGQNPVDTWTAANEVFIAALSAFQQQGIELLLLPLFAQFANLHLMLLRFGVHQGFADDSELQARIKEYGSWVDQWYAEGVGLRVAQNPAFNYVNDFNRQMQITVLNFRETWPYFDLDAYPPPVKNLVFNSQILYTIRDAVNENSGNYATPPIQDNLITDINVFWEQDVYDGFNMVMGTQVTYANIGQQQYNGILIDGKIPPVGTNDPDYFYWYSQNVAVSPANPIVAVSGIFNMTGGVWCVNFIFEDGSSTGLIPGPANQDYCQSYSITPPSGYYLTTVWGPSEQGYYDSIGDLLFAFRLKPVNID